MGRMGFMNKVIARKMLALFARIDRRVLALRTETGLRCPRCAGHCCSTDFIEVSPLDVLPAVLHFERCGKLERLLRRLDRAPDECVFFSKRPTDIKNCHCRIYLLRPTNCRLFGFGMVMDKSGKTRVAACKHQKRSCANAIGKIEGDKKISKKAVRYADVSMMLYDIEPRWGSMRMHINDALRLVAERVLLMQQISGSSVDKDRGPRRAA